MTSARTQHYLDREDIAPPDIHTAALAAAALAAAEALVPAEQLAERHNRDGDRVARHRTSA